MHHNLGTSCALHHPVSTLTLFVPFKIFQPGCIGTGPIGAAKLRGGIEILQEKTCFLIAIIAAFTEGAAD
jgi:hypothetical protein